MTPKQCPQLNVFFSHVRSRQPVVLTDGRPPITAPAPLGDQIHYTALGGSNTCGHGLPRRSAAFQHLALAGLQRHGLANNIQPSCIPAMGPDYPASCLSYFAPNTTRYATLEFTPNMGEGRELERNGLHLTAMARRLVRRGVKVVIVDLVPRPPTCASCIGVPSHMCA